MGLGAAESGPHLLKRAAIAEAQFDFGAEFLNMGHHRIAVGGDHFG